MDFFLTQISYHKKISGLLAKKCQVYEPSKHNPKNKFVTSYDISATWVATKVSLVCDI